MSNHTSRRRFLRLGIAGMAAIVGGARLARAQERAPVQIWLPLVQTSAAPEPPPAPTPAPSPTPTPEPPPPDGLADAPIAGPASGAFDQAVSWFVQRTSNYTPYSVNEIITAYRDYGEAAGVDWFLALAQCAHETGSLTSFWSARPQRNPAGLGVTGQWQADPPADRAGWAYNTQNQRWEVGISFPTWAGHAVPAHLGRLLAYALRDDQATDTQRNLIAYALSYRGLPASHRGAAPTIIGLNGRWAAPGTSYGQRILDIARRMRES